MATAPVPTVAIMGITLLSLPAIALVATTVPGTTPSGSDAGPPAPPLPPGAEVVAEGLDNPRGLLLAPDGTLWIAEAGGVPPDDAAPCGPGPEGNEVCSNTTGAITRVADGVQERVATGLRSVGERTGMNAIGPQALALGADDTLYVLFGVGADPATRADNEADGPQQLGRLFSLDPDSGELTEVVDVSAYETSDNPDGGAIDSNPFAMVALDDGSLAIADAGANALLQVGADGAISTLAVFPDQSTEATDGSEMMINAVPDALDVDADGGFYVGQLTGFPFPPDGASVYTVAAGGGDPELFAEGFTNIIDVATAPDGGVYVLELNSGGLLNVDPADPSTLAGALIKVSADGTQEVVVDGLTLPTSLAVADDGTIYVANAGVIAGAGQVLRIPAGA